MNCGIVRLASHVYGNAIPPAMAAWQGKEPLITRHHSRLVTAILSDAACFHSASVGKRPPAQTGKARAPSPLTSSVSRYRAPYSGGRHHGSRRRVVICRPADPLSAF